MKDQIKKRPLCILCALLMLLILFARILHVPIFGEPEADPYLSACMEDGRNVQITGTIRDRIEKPRSVQYILTNSVLHSEKHTIPLSTISLIQTGENRLPVGADILARGTLSVPEQASNPGQFDLRDYYASRQIYYSLFADSAGILKEGAGWREIPVRFRNSLASLLEKQMSPDSAEIMKALILGDRTGLTDEMKRNYQVGGILHILAISGMHISMLGRAVLRLLEKAGLPAGFAAPAAFLLLAAYCILTGAAASSVRALIMFAVYLGARLLLRTYDSCCALALAGILMLLENPSILFFSGFQMSFCAILTVSVFWPSVAWLLPGQVRKPGKLKGRAGDRRAERRKMTGRNASKWAVYYSRLLLHYTCFWLVINAGLLPLTVWYYYEVPIWGLFPNVLLLAAVPFLLLPGIIGVLISLKSLRVGRMLLLPADCMLECIHKLTEQIRKLPCSTWVCGKPAPWQMGVSLLLLVVLVCLLTGREKKKKRKYRKRAAVIMVLFLLVLTIRWRPVWSLTMLDVGQGDCLVLRSGRAVYLIDGGSSSVKEVGRYRILPYLRSQGISRIDGIFLSHPDEDHCNGLLEILEATEKKTASLRVDRVFLPAWMKGNEKEKEFCAAARRAGADLLYLAQGDTLQAGKTELRILNPLRTGGFISGNSGSMVISMTCGCFDALLTGDLEADGEALLLPMDRKYEYLKVAHHGSGGSSSEAFLSQVCPKVAAISAPVHSRYGHPHQETMERLEEAGACVFVTRDCGALTAEGNGKKWRIRGFLQTKEAYVEYNEQ